MKLKKVVALCNKAKGFRLFDKIDSTGEITQWLGDGYAIYPLNGLPILDEETLCAVFDISEKQRENIIVRRSEMPEAVNVDDRPSGAGFKRRRLFDHLRRRRTATAKDTKRNHLHSAEIPCPIGGRAGHDTALRAGHAGRSKLYRGKSGPFDCGGDLPLQSCERKIRDAA